MPIGNKKRFFVLAAAIALAVVLLLVFSSRLKKSENPKRMPDAEIDGTNLTYLSFNASNEKKLEIKCLESQNRGDDKLFMIKITATIFKADKLDEDIHISAESGLTTPDFNDFNLQGDVRIVSPTFTLSSETFNLLGMNELSTKDAADFKLRDMTGRAKAGLLYVFSNKTMRMLQPEGTLIRAGKPYHFQARIIRVNAKRNWLLLDQEARMEGAGSTITGDRIVLQFDQDFVNLQDAMISGNSFFKETEVAGNGRRSSREITADRIKMINDEQGRLQSLKINGNGTVSLGNDEKKGKISSSSIEISMNAETQTLEKVRTLARGELSSRGRDNVKVSADAILAVYDQQGVLTQVKAERNCVYATDDFSGSASLLDYDVPNERIVISGKEAVVVSKKNSFTSSQFLIQTKLRSLSTDKDVKATLVPEKKSVLLRSKPIFVTAAGLEMSERGEVTRFKEKVSLFQDEIELHAGELLFESSSSRMTCRGNADLKFLNENEPVALRGKEIAFHAAEREIAIEGDARLRQAENTLGARRIKLGFNKDDRLQEITASENATFSKKDLFGKAELLLWHYTRKTILFKNSAEITRKEAGTTRGRELQYDLDSNEITVSGAGDRSETTIRQESP